MEKHQYYLAIDIGASSGRHIVGWKENDTLHTREVYRFPNKMQPVQGHLVWDIIHLFSEVKNGIRAAFSQYPHIESLSIDTWGVDYVLLCGDTELFPCYAYRDGRTHAQIEQVHHCFPFDMLYMRTGCQFQPFNTIYQLADDLVCGRLNEASDFLMLPEYLLYRLTGIKVKEYTNATTTGLVNAVSGAFDTQITNALGFPSRLFPSLTQPGTILGQLDTALANELGGNCRVVLCATHDTASAVEGIDMDENAPYISSGTWSLLGVKTPLPLTSPESRKANFSNEGGIGYNRYQKNIMGLWLVQQLRQELCPQLDFTEITQLAGQSHYEGCIDVNAPELLAPQSMRKAFDLLLPSTPSCAADYFRCAFRSLANGYKTAIDELEHNTGVRYNRLYITGGGAKNSLLNEFTAEATGKQVFALPVEATALGNLKLQMEAKP